MSWRQLESMAPGEVLPPEFFARSALQVARELLGDYLCLREHPHGPVHRWVIHETEAYTGPDDKACHAAKGLTPRTQVMFGAPGHWYIYLCYGVHWMANIVCERQDHPAAVLLRGAGHADGPGKLTKGLGIGKQHHGKLAVPANGLWIETGEDVPDKAVDVTPRIGIAYAEEWVEKPFRFIWREATHDLKPAKWRPTKKKRARNR
ncbi:MAG: DNA-3-methyladenine glycosylase [Puniceicoccaceae bacterium 5H]|nr:MAG: DNA-3-methyladenine glycosylase [Puniceicoccaceae bacterium 5H]